MRKYTMKRGTSERWKELNPILEKGVIGKETDTGWRKIGDGVNHYLDLPYDNRPKSVYEQAVERGFKGSEDDWNNVVHQKFIIAQAKGYTGSELDWQNYLEPSSSYLEATLLGYEGTPQQYYEGTIIGVTESSWGTF